jgi:hypothetical protein
MAFLLPFGLAACGAEERAARERQAERHRLAVSESTATRAAAIPSTGLWTEAHLLERLVRSGVAPRAADSPATGAEWMGRRPLVLHAGGSMLQVWIYADSVARRAVTDSLDPATAAPRGMIAPFAAPMAFVVQNNLAAVVTGGSERNQERITLALQAGLRISTIPPE